jgi:fumarate hydratase class I
MYTEVNTRNNLPAQIDISAVPGSEYRFLFVNKGGGSANKAALFQETKSILQPENSPPF